MSSQAKCFLKSLGEKNPIGIGPCSGELISRESFTQEDTRLLFIRSGCRKSFKHVCQVHSDKYLKFFSLNQSVCCDPLGLQSTRDAEPPQKKKKKTSKPSLDEINLLLRDKGKFIGLKLVPGKKICITCKKTLYHKLKIETGSATDPLLAQSSPSVQSSQPLSTATFSGGTPALETLETPEQQPFKESLQGLNTWLSSSGISPISEKKLKKSKSYADKAMKKLKIALSNYSEENVLGDVRVSYYEEMIQQLRQFISTATETSKKILALSVLPKSWS